MQRIHLNAVESQCLAHTAILSAGLYRPREAAIFGLLYLLGRYFFHNLDSFTPSVLEQRKELTVNSESSVWAWALWPSSWTQEFSFTIWEKPYRNDLKTDIEIGIVLKFIITFYKIIIINWSLICKSQNKLSLFRNKKEMQILVEK